MDHEGEQIAVIESAVTIQEPKPRIRFDEWLQTIIHTHSMLGSCAFDTEQPEDQQTLQNWQDGQYSTEKLIEEVMKIGALRGGSNFVDTEHAAHSLDVYHPTRFPDKTPTEVRELRRQAFLPAHLAETRTIASERILMRKRAIEQLLEKHPEWAKRVFTGVEIDILFNGEFDISEEALLQLQVNGGSIHRDEFRDSNNGNDPTLGEVVQIYEKIASDPVTDVINHMVRELSAQVLAEIVNRPDFFDNVFVLMAKNNKALEINLRDFVDPKRRENAAIALMLAKRAKDRGVLLTLGTDFHRIEQYLPTQLPSGKSQTAVSTLQSLRNIVKDDEFHETKETAEQSENAFATLLTQTFPPGEPSLENLSPLPGNILKLARPIYQAIRQIQQAGISPEDIVNGAHDRFTNWVATRWDQKQAYRQAQIIKTQLSP